MKEQSKSTVAPEPSVRPFTPAQTNALDHALRDVFGPRETHKIAHVTRAIEQALSV